MIKYLSSVALLFLLACNTFEKIPYQPPPQASMLGGIIVEPILKVNPEYPKQAKEKGIEGWVMFKFKVGEEGKPINVKVVDSHPRGMFVPEAKSAFRKWRFHQESGENTQRLFSIVVFNQ